MDHVDYAIISFTEAWCKTMLRRYEQMQPLLQDESFHTVRYEESTIGFFSSVDEFDLAGILETNEDWNFIELEDGELSNLDKRNGNSDSYLCIGRDGNAYYFADDEIDQYETFAFNIPSVCNGTF